MPSQTRWVYAFGGGTAEGDASMRNLLGGKGANLAEMSALGLPVPPGFTITTEACNHFYAHDRSYPETLADQVEAALGGVEALTGKRFGDPVAPLLVSVRSGGRASMPGMMDTVLNLGLNDATAEGLAALAGDRRFALDSYRRFIQMYSNVVLGLDHHLFEEILDNHKERLDVTVDTALSAEDWDKVVADYKAAVEEELGEPFPQDPNVQLWGAIGAVFASWMNERARFYRRMHDIPESWGTAVNIQAMVFGNMGDSSATGVAFTRNPSTGENRLYGEFLINAQGEDVVAGIRTPQALTRAAREEMGDRAPSMEEVLPEVFSQFREVVERLERHYRDMQDVEFTVELGRLYMLQTRNGKRTAKAALKMAVDMAAEGLISREEAVMRVDPASLDQMLHPTIDPASPRDVVVTGLPASPGAATGAVVFDADEAQRRGGAGEAVILVREETSPEDIHGMHAARGIVTARGGMTSHAAVVARGMGRPCVSGAGDIRIDEKAGVFHVRGRTIHAGEVVTVDGSRGDVLAGAVQMIEPELTGDFATLMGWADGFRRLRVRANAETPLDARTARQFGAEGIGLCRTEHMFFDDQRIQAVREMILADEEAGRRTALAKILPMQRADFVEIFGIMEGLPVTIRLLDPPLHEFLPQTEEDVRAVAEAGGLDADKLWRRVRELHETNPMLGHRGCRLGISYPEIYEMQVRAIFEAACEIAGSGRTAPIVEIMHPLVAKGEEMRFLRNLTDRVAKAVMAERGLNLPYAVGTMVELPRAALRAADLAESAEFFSFGTNDLTQTTFGISRDDSGRFLNAYLEKGIFEKDPFVSLDQEGVGDLIRIAAERGRAVRPGVKLGICGEHGGDPASIQFCEAIGLDYVSCSPFRTPIARLAAAQAALGEREKDR
ncbi:pyruvate, phosphate dikinase [Phenylobacterium sp.]|uniref:pyruvate, phosphate dikinase n=1 Tax=Phenylobacterium sp. TaxID=1871053 RepID=UPI0025CEA019|nr:pyruvate, phosphate dikinase [Phenylobacterium sp.]MCA6287514.1 pyruvate, phosphate dikinase [Phenylobacterium sp.]MCA6311755.1 pyruvate, phosphate dikinase [Phenylobacterium sp.]MCA6324892.1 pyruvate, phosphate dikinase [Phenylobacterium sp.]MCA6338532.1 pyruvate, phosphate dikinase [Phenylobacterium sp.]MCA6341283.1 pyruvate, phosphate dikinase [Phenylobacterium sp.]